MIDATFLEQLARFSLVVRKRVTSSYIGPRRSISAGRGMIFKDYRVYVQGDDFRAIDWKIFARTDDLYVKNYEEERNLIVHIIVDRSGSMDYGKSITKYDYGSKIGAGFAYLALKDNDKFMFSTYADNLEIFQPRRGMSQLASMIYYLNNIKPNGNSKLLESITQYRRIIGSKALIILLSDFLISLDEIRQAFYMLGNNEIKIVQIIDPIERDLALEGDFRFKDSESGGELRTYISPRARIEYQKMLQDHCIEIEKTCTTLGMDYYLLTTDTPIFDAFYKVLE